MRVLVAGVVTIAGLSLIISVARAANASDCSDIEVVAEAQCSVLVEPECMAHCGPTSFVLACDDECSGRCDQNASLACTHQCGAWCPYECSFDPDSFDCDATCRSDCEGACPGKCRDHPSPGWCEATCRVTCDSTCSASCDELASSADCETKCGACCDASCTVQRNVECEKSCKIECTSALQSGCEARCQDTDGALFCAGQFVDTGDDVVQCVAYLASIEVPVNVDAWARLGAPCQQDDCPPRSGATLSCGAMPGGPCIGAATLLQALAIAALVTRRRRRRCA